MSKNEKQMILDTHNIMSKLYRKEICVIKDLAEQMLNAKLLVFAPDAILENMDVTEKIMLIDYYTKTEEERQKNQNDAILLTDVLKEEGIE